MPLKSNGRDKHCSSSPQSNFKSRKKFATVGKSCISVMTTSAPRLLMLLPPFISAFACSSRLS